MRKCYEVCLVVVVFYRIYKSEYHSTPHLPHPHPHPFTSSAMALPAA